MKNWVQVKAAFNQPPEDWSIFIEIFDRHGCPGTLQEDSPPSLSAYFACLDGTDARVQSVTAELMEYGASAVTAEVVPDEDWSETWKKFFKVRRIGRDIVIRPTWEEYKASPDDIVITLDPGQAFGTGDHPTTRLCLLLMQAESIKGSFVADVGCGTGVLAIAARKLGAREVIASDIDEGSVEITGENAKLNEVEFKALVAPGFDALDNPVDILVSNIISATLIRLAPEASRWVAPGGKWIVSGIIVQNWDDVKSAAERAGFELERKEQEDDWIGATFRR